MKFQEVIFDKGWKINLWLFVLSFGIYAFYFHDVFLNINSILSSDEGDALKNYYTYCFHIKNDENFLHFSGMNYPFGEHIVFTDCQPILTFILRLFPFVHPYSVGILHGLIFLSFIFTPLLIYKIILLLGLDRFSGFFISLAITLLSPQYYKLLAGHHALAYTFIIPLCILFLLRFFKERKIIFLSLLFSFNSMFFFLHPYFGLGTSLFCFISILIFDILSCQKNKFLKYLFQNILSSITPIILFKFFMVFTDNHSGRASEPQNVDALNATFGSLILPNFGPFRDILPKIFNVKGSSFEGYSYLGIFLIVVIFLFILALPFLYKKINVRKDILSIFISSLVLLFFAFGLHNNLLTSLNVKVASIDQFRASGRFIWYFYYTLPLFLVPLFYQGFKNSFTKTSATVILQILSVLYFSFNLWEANSLFCLDRAAFWKFKNIFNENYLSKKESFLIDSLKKTKPQAIIPLPFYHAGSEVYQRSESPSMLNSVLYSYHCNIPVISSFLSRTAIHETEDVIQTLNCYKKDHAIDKVLNGRDFLILKNNQQLAPDEERLYRKVVVAPEDSKMEIGFLSQDNLFKRIIDEKTVYTSGNVTDSSGTIFILEEKRKPFLRSNLKDYETIYALDSNLIKSGDYILSFRYYYKEKTEHSIACHFIINETSSLKAEWINYKPIKAFSGFYDGYAVYEQNIKINSKKHYDFMLNGNYEKEYEISHFLLRSKNTTVIYANEGDTIFNNFPMN